jgi:hypothetical protein
MWDDLVIIGWWRRQPQRWVKSGERSAGVEKRLSGYAGSSGGQWPSVAGHTKACGSRESGEHGVQSSGRPLQE